jgi:hypothetical protein
MIKGWSICSGHGVVTLGRPEACFWPFLGWSIYTGPRVVNMTGFSSNDKGLLKQLYLTLKYSERSWKKKAFQWVVIQRELMEYFGERYVRHLS